MSIASKLATELNSLMSSSLSADQPAHLQLNLPAAQLDCYVAAVDSLACELQQLVLVTPRTKDWPADRLQKLGSDLCRRLSYLLEPIAPIEIDQESAVVQMRSTPPTEDEKHGRSYYELLAQPQRLTLQRFEKTSGAPRRPRGMVFTRQVFERLVTDLHDAISSAP